MNKFDILIPRDGDFNTILDAIDAKVEYLTLMEQGINLNQQSIDLMAQRLQLQHKSLRKMISELQSLVRNLHLVAANTGICLLLLYS